MFPVNVRRDALGIISIATLAVYASSAPAADLASFVQPVVQPVASSARQSVPSAALPDDVAAFNKPTSAELAARRLLGMGFNAIRNKDYVNAEKLLLRARRIDPANAYVLLNLGVVFHNTNRPKLAKEMWTRVANSPIASTSTAVITSRSDMVGEPPAELAKRNLELLAK